MGGAPESAERAELPASAAPVRFAGPAIRSDQLLRGKRQVAIVHNDEIYVLRQTRLGKLILIK
jgi:hemin uptake protein HemP